MATKKNEPKADVVLSDGTEVFFDKHNIKPREWRAAMSTETNDEDTNAILARFAGLEFEYVNNLSMYDNELLIGASIKKVREPIIPNSPSVSTGQS